MREDILIVGGGIGGLTAALSLHHAGFSVRVLESVAELRPLGVGLNLLPHAARELDDLGLLPKLIAAGTLCTQIAYHSKRGAPIWAEARGLAAGYRWPQVSIHRGILQLELLAACRAAIGDDRIHLGHHLQDFELLDGGVRASFTGRDGNPCGEYIGRLLIAADGIHSAVRRKLYPDEGPPQWNGAVMWRGVAEHPAYLDGSTMIMAGHSHQKFVCYPIGRSPNDPALQQINFVAELRFQRTVLAEREDWNKPGQLEDFLPRFADWHFTWLDVPELIRAAPQTWVYPMVDRDPLPRWSFGALTLLGDAAHPMYPIGSNGASQAILDARALTGCLRHYRSDLERGLQRYEEIRRESTAAIVRSNRQQGPEICMQLVEDRAPDGFAHLHDVVSEAELNAIADKYKQIAGFAIAALNERPSLAEPTP